MFFMQPEQRSKRLQMEKAKKMLSAVKTQSKASSSGTKQPPPPSDSIPPTLDMVIFKLYLNIQPLLFYRFFGFARGKSRVSFAQVLKNYRLLNPAFSSEKLIWDTEFSPTPLSEREHSR